MFCCPTQQHQINSTGCRHKNPAWKSKQFLIEKISLNAPQSSIEKRSELHPQVFQKRQICTFANPQANPVAATSAAQTSYNTIVTRFALKCRFNYMNRFCHHLCYWWTLSLHYTKKSGVGALAWLPSLTRGRRWWSCRRLLRLQTPVALR